MHRPFKLTLAVAALLVGSAVPSAGQQFEYTPYRGFNNTGQPTEPPPDNYTPTHPSGPLGSGAPEQSGDAYTGSNSSSARNVPRSAPTYSAPRGTYSPTEDVFSPAPRGSAAPSQPAPPPPRGVGGPPVRGFDHDNSWAPVRH